MYMPGDDPRKMTKAALLDLDLAVLDCEDAVAVNRKSAARDAIRDALNSLDFGRTERGVRTNSVSSGLLEEDLKSVLCNKTQPDIVMIPKLDSADEAKFLNSVVSDCSSKPFPVIFQTESAIGLINLHEIIRTLKESSHVIPVAIVFGADDFVSDIRGSREIDAVVYARQKVVTFARAYNLQPIDRVYIEYKDLDGLKLESEKGFGFGFSGKQCIHPSQIPIVQTAFSPSVEQLEYSRDLIRSFAENQAAGKGAFSFRGKMIDRPTLLQAQNIVDMFEN